MKLPASLRHRRLKKYPFPIDWLSILRRNCPSYRTLPPTRRRELMSLMQAFLESKNFEGCAGFEIDDEVRVTIAAQACLLLLNRRTKIFPTVHSILVYPSEYIARSSRHVGEGFHAEFEQLRLGEAWKHGMVILSWDEIESSIYAPAPGHNLIVHEFAHQLDYEDGHADGTPLLDSHSAYARWREVMGGEFAMLQARLARGEPTIIDDYAATSPAEFFAVICELFFDFPTALREHHPRMYGLLAAYFRQDPAGKPRFTSQPESPRPPFEWRHLFSRHLLFDLVMFFTVLIGLLVLGESASINALRSLVAAVIIAPIWYLLRGRRRRR